MTLSGFTDQLVDHLPTWLSSHQFLPGILSAAIAILVGFLLALLGRALASRITGRVARRLVVWGQLTKSTRIDRLQEATGRVVYWGVLLISFMTAAEDLGLPVLTEWLGKTAAYFPRVISAVLLLGFGFLGARVVGQFVLRACRSAGIPGAERLRRATEVAIVFACVVVAVEQVGIEISFLKSFVLILVGTILAGAALAFGLGSQEVVANVLSVHYLRRQYREGQTIRFDNTEGRILRITDTAIVVESDEGQIHIPALRLAREPSLLVMKGGPQ